MPMRKAVATTLGDVLRHVADRQQFARLEHRVAVIERGDHQMMQVGGKNQGDAEHGKEVADQHALLVLCRINRR